jgi:hypothetical protein
MPGKNLLPGERSAKDRACVLSSPADKKNEIVGSDVISMLVFVSIVKFFSMYVIFRTRIKFLRSGKIILPEFI